MALRPNFEVIWEHIVEKFGLKATKKSSFNKQMGLRKMSNMGESFLRYVIGVLLWTFAVGAKEPDVLYLTWKEDPTSSMTIYWHTEGKQQAPSYIWYREKEAGTWQRLDASQIKLYKSDIFSHTADLKDLKSGSTYLFRIAEEPETYRFSTLAPGGPFHFAVGGDAFFSFTLLREMNQQVLSKEVDFVVLGGDLAYSNGLHHMWWRGAGYELKRWISFLKEWKKMRTEEGKLIPLIVTPGNHDVYGDGATPQEKGRRLNEFFPFPEGASYRALDIGESLSLFLLDTGHIYPVEGAQTAWLRSALEDRSQVSYKLAIYHISAYPAFYAYKGRLPTTIRTHWVPLFEQKGVLAAFEHHNHVFKRTFPIKEGGIDPEGVVYLGDGSWGVPARSPHPAWYLASAKKTRCFWTVRIDTSGCLLEAYDSWGKRLDALTLSPCR